jgi:hypothetical protein
VWDLHNYSKDIVQVIRNGIDNHLSASTISSQLDGFILPNRHVTTLTPYGRAVNYDTMRLARTEIMEAYREAAIENARNSPWIWGLRWELSNSHKDLCECDDYDGQVFAPDDVPMYPHPQCACALIPETMDYDDWGKTMDQYLEGDDEAGISDWLDYEISA